MYQSAKTVTESTLNQNLNELSQSLVRELAMAAKKVAIYGTGHPVSVRSMGKPLLYFSRLFNIKRYVNINMYKGDLYVLNISQPDNIFTKEIIKFMQIQDVKSILFEEDMSTREFTVFIDHFVKRTNISNHNNQLGPYLRSNGIKSIEANSEKGFNFFESNRQYRGDVDGDFSVRNFALDQLSQDIQVLSEINSKGITLLEKYQIDFHADIIEYILPEKIASIDSEKIIGKFNKLNRGSENRENSGNLKEDELSQVDVQSLISLLEFHPDKENIVESLDSDIDQLVPQQGLLNKFDPLPSEIKATAQANSESILDKIFNESIIGNESNEFHSAFLRLLKTGQQDKAAERIGQLIEFMGDVRSDIRQKSMSLLIDIFDLLGTDADQPVLESGIRTLNVKLIQRQETFEYSEVLWHAFLKTLNTKRYDLCADMTAAAAKRKYIENDVTIFDSMAVKQLFANINRKEILDRIIDKLLNSEFEDAVLLRKILINIGSEEVAMALTNIISHPERSVRQQSLKILSELGKSALKVCSQVLMDDSHFERDDGRHELPDYSWYIIRNAIFVIGQLKDENGVLPLRFRITDQDVRIRREIITSLEKIGGEDACDILILMIDDPIREIVERAIITISLIGTPDVVPLMIDVARNDSSILKLIITALGKIGGKEAVHFLGGLLEDEDELNALAGASLSKEEVKLVIVKAIGNLGDLDALKKVKELQSNMSTTQKIFFKNSPVNKAISDILSKRK